MKTLIWLLLLAIFICYISSNDVILSKFHQHGYKVKDVRMELKSYNEKFYNFVEIKTYKYNRTTPAINATFNLKISVKDKLEVVVQALKFMSNEYRHFPMRFQLNLKKAIESNAIGLDKIKYCGNLTDYSFEKDVTYHACNFVVDETRAPPLMPNGRFKFELQLLYFNEEVAIACLFAEIYTPIPHPKK